MTIKKVQTGYEIRFRVAGRGSRTYKRIFPTKGECNKFECHTFASHFMMNGGNILTLQKVLGHSDIKMTMRYSHLSPDFLEEATRLNPLSNIKQTRSHLGAL